ncbi:MAG: AAA family ATPase [Bacteroidia bacterium]|nr:AAA family ATPase [Bacteroidia bacterium]
MKGYTIDQADAVNNMIEGSLFRCGAEFETDFPEELPPVSPEGIERSKQHIIGHTKLIRESAPEYYRQLTEVLNTHNAVLCYVAYNFDVYARYGDQQLKDELKAINLRFGTNLAEETVGTNAAALASHSLDGVWVIGEQNYAKALRPYAFYGFTVHGEYSRYVHILLITRKEMLTDATISVFKLIEATETIFSGGLFTEDILLKDALLRYNYSEKKTDEIFLVVGSSGQITYANELFYDTFKTDYNDIINLPLQKAVPELGFALDVQKNGHEITRRLVPFSILSADITYDVKCIPINRGYPRNGIIITARRTSIVPARKLGTQGNFAKYCFDDLVGVSDQFKQLKYFARRISNTQCTVLILGESGTGKELFAHSIHSASDRWSKPFISVNCAGIPRELIGSELFGYAPGSFTGANKTGAKGKFEAADGGTLFLDEIAEMPADMQSVLLRVIEEKTVTRIGDIHPIAVDVRLIVATNQDLNAYIRERKFRSDLYYRLNTITLNVMPLRERREDIFSLAEVFRIRFSELYGKKVDGFSAEVHKVLAEYDWPGNVRELRNAVERSIVTTDGRIIELYHLPAEIRTRSEQRELAEQGVDAEPAEDHDFSYLLYRKEMAERLMREYNGNKSKVAQHMGIARTTLYRILAWNKEE